MSALNRLAFAAVVGASILLAACGSSPVAPPEIVNAAPAASVTPAATASQATNKATLPATVAATPLAAYLDPQNRLSRERSVYFDFDQAIVKPDAAPLLEVHGRFLATHPAVSIKIEGNTDERGGSEYNLALGQKRAEAVLKALRMYGVKESQMEAISFGKEKPKAPGHDETAYAQNRRADLDYPGR